MNQEDKRRLLRIAPSELQEAPAGDRLIAKGLMQIRQSLYDIMGAYPQDNVMPYLYAFSRTNLKSNAIGANATVQDNTRISADAAFIATQITATSTGNYLILPRQDASDRQIVNEAVHNNTIAGTAERPHYLPKPWYLPANTTVSYEITNLTGQDNEVYWCLVGYKIYRR